MKSMVIGLGMMVIAAPAMAAKPCEELKSEIAAKIDAKGVKEYTLTVVPTADVTAEQKVVGGCDGGKSKIVYKRGQQV